MSPETQTIAISFANDHVAILHYVTHDRRAGWRRLATKENIEAEIAKSAWPAECVLPVKSWRFIDVSEIPTDRTYRNAWTDVDRKLGHDLPKAREIHREHLRRKRGPILAQLDVDFMRASERGDAQEMEKVVRQKQYFRDITKDQRIDAAASIEDLKKVSF